MKSNVSHGRSSPLLVQPKMQITCNSMDYNTILQASNSDLNVCKKKHVSEHWPYLIVNYKLKFNEIFDIIMCSDNGVNLTDGLL